ncbi:MAG: hypothetical protein C4524_12990 [Candidatus Zixiibacteriota bacterium]|nr:MAG: hypothetical protein C4524_12990 [candidate division Zixibacteria bacterium]
MWVLLVMLLPLYAYAQVAVPPPVDVVESTTVVLPGAHFFVAILAGIILAFAFQLILTNLSVAAGLNVLGSVTKSGKQPQRGRRSTSQGDYYVEGKEPGDRKEQRRDQENEGPHATVRKFSSAAGAWTLITATISLFFAAWLGVQLTPAISPLIGAVLGLSIWGLFYLVTMILEVSAVSSLIGSIFNMAATGLRTAYQTVSSVLTKSPEEKIVDTAEKIVEKAREEFFGDVDFDDVKKQIGKYVDQLSTPKFEPEDFRREIAKLLDDVELRAVVSHDEPFFDVDVLSADLEAKGGMSKEKARDMAGKVQDAFGKIREESSGDKSRADKVVDSAMRVAGMSGEDARGYREKVEDYLRRTGKSELNPEGIKRDIEQLFHDPKGGMTSLRERVSQVDKSTIASLLAQRQDMTREEAERIADQIDNAVHQLISGSQTGKGAAQSAVQGVQDRILGKVSTYLNSLHEPELRYEDVARDMRKLFYDPKAGAESLLNRLKSLDRESLKAIIASTSRKMSEEDAERLLQRIEGARDNVIERAERMRDEVEYRLEQAKQEALHQADETRKTAAVAAWWAFGTALVSGIAAALGGIIAIG